MARATAWRRRRWWGCSATSYSGGLSWVVNLRLFRQVAGSGMLSLMLPEEFSFRGFESRSGLGALPGIIHFSMSFRNAIRCGYMPPLHIFNAFVVTCRDDIDEEARSALDIETDSVNWGAGESVGAVLTWSVFELLPVEYERLITFIVQRYGAVAIDDFGVAGYSQWFTSCFETGTQNN